MPKSLATKASAWTAVFRAIVQKLEADPDIHRVVGTGNIRSWKGVDGDKAPFVPSGGKPVLRLTPQPSAVDWYMEGSQAGTLTVRVEMAIETLCIDDVADLWDMIVIALRPCQAEFDRALVDLGAETGEIVFSDPAMVPHPDGSPEGYFLSEGSFRLKVIRPLLP